MINLHHNELAEITQNIFMHGEENMEEIREQISRKLSLLNLKGLDDTSELKNEMTAYVDASRQRAIETFQM